MAKKKEEPKPSPTVSIFEQLKSRAKDIAASADKNTFVRVAIAVCVLILIFAVSFILDRVFAYRLASGYIDKIANVFDLNEHLATALTLILFPALVFLGGYVFSFRKQNRLVGITGIMTLLILNSLVLWQGTKGIGIGQCYVIDGANVRYRERAGIDPVTGRECRPVTEKILAALRLYEQGKRPQQIKTTAVEFFDARNGEPIVWYARNAANQIEIFDLMGYHPQTGVELLPVTPAVADEWRAWARSVIERGRTPKPVNPETVTFFEPTTGRPIVWYWHDDKGHWEFFDNQGYHPRTGEPLLPISKEIIQQWQQSHAVALTPSVPPMGSNGAVNALATSAALCDQLAANPHDANKPSDVDGMPFDNVKAQAQQAVAACRDAVNSNQGELRYQYQLARAYEFVDRNSAIDLFQKLIKANYPAAFDNFGSMYVDGRAGRVDFSLASQLFRRGAALGDTDAMLSLGRMLVSNKTPERSADEGYQWITKAAQAGNDDAVEWLEKHSDNDRPKVPKGMKLLQQFLGGFAR